MAGPRPRDELPATTGSDADQLHAGDEIASVVDGVTRAGTTRDPDVIVRCDATWVYHLLIDGEVGDGAEIEGDRDALERLARAAPVRRAEAAATVG